MKNTSVFRSVLRYFMQGLLIIAPLSITIYVLYISFNYVDGLLKQTIEQLIGIGIPGLGIVVVLIGITIIGFLGSTVIFKPLLHYFDKLISKAPVVKIIYTALKDFFSAFVGNKKKFTEPVLIKVYRGTDLQKLGFITNRDLSLLGISGEKVAVYMPHSFAFSGNMFIVPVENITPLDAAPADVMKFIVSAGVTEISKTKTKEWENQSY